MGLAFQNSLTVRGLWRKLIAHGCLDEVDRTIKIIIPKLTNELRSRQLSLPTEFTVHAVISIDTVTQRLSLKAEIRDLTKLS